MANRCFRLSLQLLANSSYRECDLNFQSTNTNDNDTVAAGESLVNGFHTAIRPSFLATIPSNMSLVRLTARRVTPVPSATACRYYGIGLQSGTRGTNITGQQTCPAIFLVPTMGVKSGGKIFWPGVPQGDLVTNVLTAGWIAAVDTCIAAMVAGFTNSGITWTLCVFSRKLGTISNVASHSFSPVVGFQGKRRKPIGAV